MGSFSGEIGSMISSKRGSISATSKQFLINLFTWSNEHFFSARATSPSIESKKWTIKSEMVERSERIHGVLLDARLRGSVFSQTTNRLYLPIRFCIMSQ